MVRWLQTIKIEKDRNLDNKRQFSRQFAELIMKYTFSHKSFERFPTSK